MSREVEAFKKSERKNKKLLSGNQTPTLCSVNALLDSPYRRGHGGDGVLRCERSVLAVQTAFLDQDQVGGVDDDRQHAGDVTEGIAGEIAST